MSSVEVGNCWVSPPVGTCWVESSCSPGWSLGAVGSLNSLYSGLSSLRGVSLMTVLRSGRVMGTSPPNLARPIGHWGNGGTQWQDRGVIPGLPQREANPDLPPAVTIYEVGQI